MPWKRRPFGSNDLSRALNIADLREIARRRVPGFAFEYVEGGAENEVTLRANREALERLRLIPRTLINTAARHQRTAILGHPANARDIMQRAAAAGYEALVFTTDANVFGNREWDQRSYRAPGKPTLRTALDVLRHPRWLFEVLGRHGMPRFRNLEAFLPPSAATALGGSTVIPPLFDATISWDDITWIRQLWRGRLLIKGVLSVADAERAAALGCDGIVLSNHGGRQLDSCVTPIEVLPQIARAVGERLTILVDSGFRRGTDIVKALALGAQAIMIGRATLYGLAAAGEPGVERALAILSGEIHRVLGQLGCNSIAELGPQHVRGA